MKAERLEMERKIDWLESELKAEQLDAKRLDAERLKAEQKAEQREAERLEAEQKVKRLESDLLEAERKTQWIKSELKAERSESERKAEHLKAEQLKAKQIKADLEAKQLLAERKETEKSQQIESNAPNLIEPFQTVQPAVNAEEVNKPSNPNCKHYFGYLGSRKKGEGIPESCLECPKSLDCMLGDYYKSKESVAEIKKWYPAER